MDGTSGTQHHGGRENQAPDTEKLTINLGVIDLGQIDLLVQEGFYANRTDLIRTAIRNQIAAHADAVRQTVARRTLLLGLQDYSAQRPRGRAQLRDEAPHPGAGTRPHRRGRAAGPGPADH